MSQTYISLFSGIGGSDLAFKYLLKGFRCVGYVEFEKYCQDVLCQRIEDGLFDEAPIFGDIRAFNRKYASVYKGMVSLITAGFPCQPFSVAGKQAGKDDARNMWPATIETIRIVRPKFAFLENVPGLLSSKSGLDEITGRPISYCATIFRDLAEAGYDASLAVIGADDVGARHRRKRLWILGWR